MVGFGIIGVESSDSVIRRVCGWVYHWNAGMVLSEGHHNSVPEPSQLAINHHPHFSP